MKRFHPYYIPLILFAAIFLGRTLYYYRGIYLPPRIPTSEPLKLQALSNPIDDALIPIVGAGLVLVDADHGNNLTDEEATPFLSRIAAAGGQVEQLEQREDLREKLRGASAFVVLVNRDRFDSEDVRAVQEFVEKGGRLLIAGDPTRTSDVEGINSLASPFGINYQDAYLYNLVEHDGNFVNVIYRDFAESELTEGVEQIIFQGGHPLQVREGALVMGDENTYSSLSELPGGATAAALTHNGQVLALPDVTFLMGPYNTFGSNSTFINNIVRFLLGGERGYGLEDFPYFYEEQTELVYTDSDALNGTFDDAMLLRDMLASINVGSQFGEAYHDGSLIYLGFFSDLDGGARDALSADGVSFGRPVSSPPTPVPTETPAETPTAEGNGGEDAGEAAAITATPTPLPTIAPIRTGGGASSVTIAGAGTFDLDERALFHLHRTADGGYQLIVLAGNAQELAAAIELLLTGGMQDCLITAQTALCSISEIVQPSPTATLTPTETFTPPPFLSETPGDTPTPGTPPPNPIPPD